MNQAAALFTSYFECRVYVELTDMFGVVYHGHYFKLFERARTEMLREHGMSIAELVKKQILLGIHEANIKYHIPARMDDILRIETRLIEVRGARMVFEQIMQNQHNKRVCELVMTVVFLDEEFQPRRIPKPVQEYIDKYREENRK